LGLKIGKCGFVNGRIGNGKRRKKERGGELKRFIRGMAEELAECPKQICIGFAGCRQHSFHWRKLAILWLGAANTQT
jgi:hypothetical protein